MMASRDYIFAGGQPSPALLCPICQDIYQRPIITRECGHSYCKICLAKAVQQDSSCPLCREKISLLNALPNLVLESIVGEILVRCRRNCGWTGALQSLGSHEDSNCPNRPVSCSGIDVGCKWNGPSSQIDGHQSNCPFILFREFITSTRSEIASLKTTVREQSIELEFLRHHAGISASHGTLRSSQDPNATRKVSEFSGTPSSSSSQLIMDSATATAAAPIKSIKEMLIDTIPRMENTKTILGHTRGVTSLAFDGRYLFSGSHDTRIKVWDALKDFEPAGELDGHDYTVWALCLVDGKLYSGSADCTIREWELMTPPNADTPFTAKHLRTIRIPAANSKIYAVKVSGNFLFAASYKSIYVWDLRLGEVAHVLPGHTDSVWSLAVYNDQLFSCSDDHSVRIWDLTSFSETAHLVSDEPESRFLSLAVGCGFIFAGTQDAKIKVWNLDTLQLVATLSGHSWEVWQLAIHPAGFLFSSSFDHSSKCWIIPSGNRSEEGDFACIHTLKAHKGYIHALMVDAPSNKLFSGSGDKSIKVWTYKKS